jgi:hypothetical protein
MFKDLPEGQAAEDVRVPVWALALPIIAALIVLRIPALLVDGRFWAEEGVVYFFRAWHLPFREALLAAHSGYLNLYANTVALAARHLVPLERAPQVTALAALTIQLLPAALIAGGRIPWLRHPAALCLAMLATILPLGAGEVWLNSITSHFHLMLACGIILAVTPRRGPAEWLRLATLALSTLSGPGSALLGPLFLIRAVRERTRARLVQLLVFGTGAAIQAAIVLSQPATPRHTGIVSTLTAIGINEVILPLAGQDRTRFLAYTLFQEFERGAAPWWPAVVPVAAFGLFAFAVWRRRDATTLWLFLGGLWLAIASFGTALVVENPNYIVLWVGPRYAYAPTVLLMLALLGLAAGRSRAAWGARALAAWIWLVAVAGYTSILPAFTTGPAWREQVALWRANPAHLMAIWPAGDVWKLLLSPVPGKPPAP